MIIIILLLSLLLVLVKFGGVEYVIGSNRYVCFNTQLFRLDDLFSCCKKEQQIFMTQVKTDKII